MGLAELDADTLDRPEEHVRGDIAGEAELRGERRELADPPDQAPQDGREERVGGHVGGAAELKQELLRLRDGRLRLGGAPERAKAAQLRQRALPTPAALTQVAA
eukprot:4357498-Alexandrium_andersonii.AAC.1